jgi:hypothetical protein
MAHGVVDWLTFTCAAERKVFVYAGLFMKYQDRVNLPVSYHDQNNYVTLCAPSSSVPQCAVTHFRSLNNCHPPHGRSILN